ncbi:hypothetical protein ACFQZX_03035 [Mucilaginibacter litoreus]|uniref:DUF922 domain-containing protein n=1 Tax=Mucilaginibacter litoreus TaxID=1048221 RepID=A0ABW3AQN5_9SPHI
MIKRASIFILTTMVCFCAFARGQAITYITLKSKAAQIKPKEYFIASIEDDRAGKSSVGKLQPYVLSAGKPGQAYSIDIKDGFKGVKTFINESTFADKSMRPVLIKFKNLNVEEANAEKGAVTGAIKLNIEYYLIHPFDTLALTNYNTTIKYKRKSGPATQVEPMISDALTNAVTYLNNWMNEQAATNLKLARAVRLMFNDYNEPAEDDTIYYSVKRPLTWSDFKARPAKTSRFGAEIFAGFGYDEDTQINNGIITVTLDLKVWTAKSACWVTAGTKTDYALNHEQRHFEIAKLAAEHFKQRLLNQKLPVDNFDGEINVAYLDAMREMHTMQKTYDDDTQHSGNTYQQQAWNIRIDKELESYGIKRQNI